MKENKNVHLTHMALPIRFNLKKTGSQTQKEIQSQFSAFHICTCV